MNLKIINEISLKGIVLPELSLCNRAKLDTGTHCNYDCVFCYYKDELTKITPFEIIKERINYLKSCGITELDLSGGESSIHKDWFKILDYCKELGFKISTLSNGSKFSDFEFLKKSKEHGLEEILFSVHGYDEKSHDKLVQRKGAFKKLLKSIDNVKKLDLRIRINCTVTEDNFFNLDTVFVDIVNYINPLEVNFLTLNHWGCANNISSVNYNVICEKIKQCIDKISHIKYINVRYTPYCFMLGYEKYVCNYIQHMYDPYDWNMALYNYDITPEYFLKNKEKVMLETAGLLRVNSYKKNKSCMKCKYFYICDGIENKNDSALIHIPGEKINNPLEYRMDFYEN